MENKKYSNQDNSNSQRNNFKKKTYSNDFQKREYRNSNEQSGDRPKTYSKSSNYVKKEYVSLALSKYAPMLKVR